MYLNIVWTIIPFEIEEMAQTYGLFIFERELHAISAVEIYMGKIKYVTDSFQ